MADPRVVNLARILVNYSTEVKEKDLVAIVAQPLSTPLVQEIYREVLHCGAYPYVLPYSMPYPSPGFEGLDQILFSEANDDQLQHIDPFWKMAVEDFDVRITIGCRYNTRSLSNVDPQRMSVRQKAYADLFRTFMERSTSGDLRRVNTLYPTQAQAQDAGMSFNEFADYVYSTTFSDCDDPVAEWNKIHCEQQILVDWLQGKKTIKLKGPDVDLTLSIKERVFINSDGKQNMPSGEIFTGPVEDSANGWVRISHPAIYMGHEVTGIKLRFEHGKVVEASASGNEPFLRSVLDTDKGSRYLGEFAIGTNKKIDRFIKSILFDEKIGGTIHMALGAGYPNTGSKNISAIHWDMICDMHNGGQIYVDEELFYESGEFLI